jgi:hypothetical protein
MVKIAMQKLFTYLSIFLILVFNTSVSNEYVIRPIEEHINEATLIVKGKLIEKYVKQESVDGIRYKVFTTYVFLVEEILKGKYSKNTIEVKMIGGRDKNTGNWDSNPFAYNYNIDDTAVLFLGYYKDSKAFKVTQSFITAFIVDEQNHLFRFFNSNAKSSSYVTWGKDNNFIQKQNLDLKTLKSIIKRLK